MIGCCDTLVLVFRHLIENCFNKYATNRKEKKVPDNDGTNSCKLLRLWGNIKGIFRKGITKKTKPLLRKGSTKK